MDWFTWWTLLMDKKTYRRAMHKFVKLIDQENESSCRGEDVRAASGNSPSPSSGN